MKIRKILLPTEVTDRSTASTDLAVALAKQHGAELLLYHAVLTHENDLRRIGELLEEFLDRLVLEGSENLRREAARLEKEHDVVARAFVERKASAYEAIRERVRAFEPDLVVMGTHHHSRVERWFLGSVAEKVVRHVPVPVLTVRPDAEPRVGRLALVPVDFSDNSRRAIDAAFGVAGEASGLVVLHVVLNPAFAGIHPGDYVRVFQIDTGLPAQIRERMEEWMGDRDFEAEVREADDVAECILAVAEEKKADLIAIGSRGLTGVDYFLMGSVAEKVVRRSPIPVLTVK